MRCCNDMSFVILLVARSNGDESREKVTVGVVECHRYVAMARRQNMERANEWTQILDSCLRESVSGTLFRVC
jgi:hypothetical protein